MVSHIPDAIEHGAEIRTGCMAYRNPAGRRRPRDRRALFPHAGRRAARARKQQRAKAVIVAGYAIETPRLLLNSTSSRFPQGLANSSGLVGKFLMAQAGPVVWGRFEEMIRQYKAPPACACSEEFYETDPRNDFVRGYALQTVVPLPIAMAHMLSEDGTFGEELMEAMQDYNHYAAIGVLGEILPDERNFVSIHPTEKDQFGIPFLRALQSLRERRADDAGGHREGRGRAGRRRARPTYARAAIRAPGRYLPHGLRPADSVVDQWCRVGCAQPVRLRRQRAAHARLGQPRAHHIGAGGPHCELDSPQRAPMA